MKYSLRSLMILVTLVCVVLGGVMGRIEYLRRWAVFHEAEAERCRHGEEDLYGFFHHSALGVQYRYAAKPNPPLVKNKKRSSERGEARAKLIATLTRHHQYAGGSSLNQEPIGNNELARLAGVSESTASEFFTREFKGHVKYRAACADMTRLLAALKLLNREFAPHLLLAADVPDEVELEDEE